MALHWLLWLAYLAAPPAEAGPLGGEIRSWLKNSQAADYARAQLAADGDRLTFWASDLPTPEPPKDLGVLWPEPRQVGSLVVRFHSRAYCPAPDSWRVEAQLGDDETWTAVPATLLGGATEWWTLVFPPMTCRAVRLLVTAYANRRPAICEIEVYPDLPPSAPTRRSPLADGGFWSFGFDHWASRYRTDAELAAVADQMHAVGLNAIFLYTLVGRSGGSASVVPDCGKPQPAVWRGRDPVGAILAAADRLGMRVYLSDAPPHGANEPQADPDPIGQHALDTYRAAMLRRYADHPSLAGYYLDFECAPNRWGNDPAGPAAASESLASLVKTVSPALEVIQPVGLYQWREGESLPRLVRPADLARFWPAFMAAAPSIDSYLIIDGVGTGLATLNTTWANQRYLAALCRQLGKRVWIDVECADFSSYQPFQIDRLRASLTVAAEFADQIVLFDPFNYLSPSNGRPAAARLYQDYAAWRSSLQRSGQ